MTRVLLALGGNAILRARDRGTIEAQQSNIQRTAGHIAAMVLAGHEVVVSHGNGPQVGNILLQNELAASVVPPRPLDVVGAESQGQIGYMLQQALANELERRGSPLPVVSLITQTLVRADDPAFTHPSKPVGPFLSAAEARGRMEGSDEAWIEDAGRGWRRVVPSPRPLAIVEVAAIAALRDAGAVVVAAGGGGVPVVRRPDGTLSGVAAVVDKDLAAARLAEQLGMEVLLILTDVSGVALDYGSPQQRLLREISVAELARYAAEGAFAPGSMGPKVDGALQFVHGGGTRAVICALEDALDGLAGRAGTQVVPRRAGRTAAAA